MIDYAVAISQVKRRSHSFDTVGLQGDSLAFRIELVDKNMVIRRYSKVGGFKQTLFDLGVVSIQVFFVECSGRTRRAADGQMILDSRLDFD